MPGEPMTEPRAGLLRRYAEKLSGALPPLLVEAERLVSTLAIGVHGRKRSGQGETFWQYRAAQPGDSLGQIDWRRSARSDRLYVRETEWEAAESVLEAFMGLRVNIMVQEFIKEAGGADLRCFVIGDKVVATMKRQGKEGEFRSNLHRGGTATVVRITPEERSTAVRAAQTMGLNVAGVDLLRSNHGPVVMEVNSSPGLEGIEGSTGKDIAGMIVEFIERRVTELADRTRRTRTRGRG